MDSYDKPAIAYNILRDVLGDSLYLKALHAYVDRWNGKHPIPYDFFFTFNDVLEQNLNWFWNPWFFEQGYPDLAVKEVKQNNQEMTVVIEKVGRMPIPVSLTIEYADSTSEKIYATAAAWKEGNKTVEMKFSPPKKVTRLVLGHEHIPDVNQENNVYEMK